MKRPWRIAGIVAGGVLIVLVWVGFSPRPWEGGWREKASAGEIEARLQSVGDDPRLLATLISKYLALGDIGRAQATADKAARQFPKSPDVLRAEGEILLALRRLPEAENKLRESLADAENAETRLTLARALIPQQRYPEITALCAPLIAAQSSLTITKEQRLRALLYDAGARRNGPLTSAELSELQAQLREAIAQSALLPPEERFLAGFFLGDILVRIGKPAEAVAPLESSVQQNPMFPASQYALARAYYLSGSQEKARAAFARHERLSHLLSELDSLNTRLEQKPDDAETLFRLAGVLAESDNCEQAAAVYKRLIAEGKRKTEAQSKLESLPCR